MRMNRYADDDGWESPGREKTPEHSGNDGSGLPQQPGPDDIEGLYDMEEDAAQAENRHGAVEKRYGAETHPANTGKKENELTPEDQKALGGCLIALLVLGGIWLILNLCGLSVGFWDIFFSILILGGILSLLEAIAHGNILMAMLLPWFIFGLLLMMLELHG